MKTILPFLLSIFFLPTSAQQPETKFLERKSVRWAAYAADTFRFNNPNLSEEIRKQLLDNKIKIVKPGWDDHIYFDDKYDLNTMIRESFGLIDSQSDSAGNQIYVAPPRPSPNDFLFDPKKFTKVTNDLVEPEQFLYFENEVLQTHVSWVSVKYELVTPQGLYLGIATLFDTYRNKSVKIKNNTKKKSIRLGNTSMTVNDSFFTKNMIKQWYGESFVKALWPGLSNKNVDVILLDSSKKILVTELNQSIWNKSGMPVPIYDSLGDMSGSRIENWPLDISVFNKVEILQEWFYNPSKQIVWNNITSIILYAHKFVNGEFEITPSPLLKIVYK